MLAGSNPAARTSQSQSPRSPYRGAGRLFFYPVRRLDDFLPLLHDMRFFPFYASRLSNCDMRFSSPISPPPVSSFRTAASENPIRFAVPHTYAVWRDVIPSPSSPRSLTDGRGDSVIAPLPAALSVQSASRFPPCLAFRRAARLLCLLV